MKVARIGFYLTTAALLVGMSGACGSSPDEEDLAVEESVATSSSSGERNPVDDSTTEIPTSTSDRGDVDRSQFVYASCDSEGLASIGVLDIGDMSTAVAAHGIRDICVGRNDAFPGLRMSESGRFVFKPVGTTAFEVIDLETGSVHAVTEDDLREWATALSSSGLGATHQAARPSGFAAAGDGTVYLSIGPGLDGDPVEGGEVFAQQVADFWDAPQLDPTALPTPLVCHYSYNWSPDNSHCSIYDEDHFLATSETGWRPASDYGYELSDETTYAPGDPKRTQWISPETAVMISGGSSLQLYAVGVGEEARVLYEVSGDRAIQLWTRRGRDEVLLASPTLAGDATEVYLVNLTGEAEPTLLGSIPEVIIPLVS